MVVGAVVGLGLCVAVFGLVLLRRRRRRKIELPPVTQDGSMQMPPESVVGKKPAVSQVVETKPSELEESGIAEMPTPQAELEGRNP